MGIGDFCACTPREFRAIYDAWMEQQRVPLQREWEVGRFIVMNLLQPYSKKVLRPRDIAFFPWDHDAKDNPVAKGPESTYERMKEVEARLKRVNRP